MARLVIQSGGAAGSGYPLSEGLNRIGRAEGNEVRIEGPSVSACHCELWIMKERVLVRDLGSTNGTFVDGRPVTETELPVRGRLSVGGVEFTVEGIPGRDSGGSSAEDTAGLVPPAPPRFTADGEPSCVNHRTVAAGFRCPKCGEQFCRACIRLLGRRGGRQHPYCPLCHAECVPVLARKGGGDRDGDGGWLAKLTQTLKLGRL